MARPQGSQEDAQGRLWLFGSRRDGQLSHNPPGPTRTVPIWSSLLRMKNTGAVRSLTGVYRDELVSTNTQWAFTRRSFVLHHQHALGKEEADPG